MSFNNAQIRCAFEPSREAFAGLLNHSVLTRFDARHVHLHFTFDHDAEIRRAARKVGHARTRYQSFGRDAPDIHAGTAK